MTGEDAGTSTLLVCDSVEIGAESFGGSVSIAIAPDSGVAGLESFVLECGGVVASTLPGTICGEVV